MGNCTLNIDNASDILVENIGSLNDQNIARILARGASSYSNSSLHEDIRKKGGEEEGKQFIEDSIQRALANPMLGILGGSGIVYLKNIMNSPEALDHLTFEWINELTNNATVNSSVASVAPAQPTNQGESNNVLEMLEGSFLNMEEYYSDEFLPVFISIFNDAFLAHLDELSNEADINADEIVKLAKKSLQQLKDDAVVSQAKFISGEATAAERVAYYGQIGLNELDLLLRTEILYINKDGNGEYFINDSNVRGRVGYVSNNKTINGYQVSDMIEGFIASTERLRFNYMKNGVPVYSKDPGAPFLTKNDIILIGQYLQQSVTGYMEDSGKLIDMDYLRTQFSKLSKNPSEEETLLHSIVTKYFNAGPYIILDNNNNEIEKKGMLGYAQGNIEAKSIINKIRHSISSQLATGVGSRFIIFNGVVYNNSGLKSNKEWELKEIMNSAADLDGEYNINPDNLKILAVEDENSPVKYKLRLALDSGESMELAFETNFNTVGNANNKGLRPTAQTLEMLQDASPYLLRKYMAQLNIPSGLVDVNVITKYKDMTNSRPKGDPLKFEHVFANMAVILAMNLEENQKALKKISRKDFPKPAIINKYFKSTNRADPSKDGTEVSASLQFNPFQTMPDATILLNQALIAIHGTESFNMYKDIEGGSEFGVVPLSPALQANHNIARAQMYNMPSGVGTGKHRIVNTLPAAARGGMRMGKNSKSVSKFTTQEHMYSVINTMYLNTLDKSNGVSAAFSGGSATDTGRPHHVMIEGENLLVNIKDKEGIQGLKDTAAKYQIEYYTALKNKTLENWQDYLKANKGKLKLNVASIAKHTKNLRVLNTYLQTSAITLTDVKKKMVSELDYIPGDKKGTVQIKPEYIYLAEDIFRLDESTGAANALTYLNKQYMDYMNSKEIKKLKLLKSNESAVGRLLRDYSLSKNDILKSVKTSYFWNATVFRDMFRRSLIGDTLVFKGSVSRTKISKKVKEQIQNLKLSRGEVKAGVTIDYEAQLEQALIDASLGNMMKEGAKRFSSAYTGSSRPDLKGEGKPGSYLQSYNPTTKVGGIHSITFDAIGVDGLNALGARDFSGLSDIYDGSQWGHPLFFKQFSNGLPDSHRMQNGSAAKPTAMENDGYSGRLQKNSVQDTMTYENLKRSPVLSWLLKMANTKISFNNNKIVTIKVPAVSLINGEAVINIDELIDLKVKNMHDLYMHFGGELGHNVYEGMDSWEFIHKYVISGENYPDSDIKSGLTNDMSNKYVGIISTTSSQKMGNRKINSSDSFNANTPADALESDIIDPYNYGSILNANEDVNSSEGVHGSTVKMFTQVMRSVVLGGDTAYDSEIIHTSKALLSDIGYTQAITDQIDNKAIGILIKFMSNPVDSILSDALQRKLDALKPAIKKSGGITANHYNVFKSIIEEAGDELKGMATRDFFLDIAKDSLKSIDHQQDILKGLESNKLNFNSKQIRSVISNAFYAVVNKATIRQSFKGSHTVLGPAHGLIKLYNTVDTDGNIIAVTTIDEYIKSSQGTFRSLNFKEDLSYMSMSSRFRLKGTVDEITLAELVFQAREERDITISQAYDIVIQDIKTTADTYEIKLPDLSSGRDLKYGTQVRQEFDESKQEIVSVYTAEGQLESIYDSEGYKELTQMFQHKKDRVDAVNAGTLYMGAIDLSEGYKPPRNIDLNKIFQASTVEKALKKADAFVDSIKDTLVDNELFKVEQEIYVYQEATGMLVPYGEAYPGRTYIGDAKYNKDEFDAFKAISDSRLDYDSYISSVTAENDINDEIYESFVRYKQNNLQSELVNVITVANIADEDMVNVSRVFKNTKDFNQAKGELDAGYYKVGNELYKKVKTRASKVKGKIQFEEFPLWSFESTELIMAHPYQREFFIDSDTSLSDFYDKNLLKETKGFLMESREASKAAYEIFLSTGKEDAYMNTLEYDHFRDNFEFKLTEEINDNESDRIPSEVFINSNVTNDNVENSLAIEEEYLRNIYTKYPLYQAEISNRLGMVRAHINSLKNNKSDSFATIIVRQYNAAISSMKENFIADGAHNRAMSFNASHYVFFTRIPSQDKQSYSKGRIIAYSSMSANTVLSPADLILISGADYDIDKLFNMVYDINSRGKLAISNNENLVDSEGNVNADEVLADIEVKLEAYIKSISGTTKNMGVFNRLVSKKKELLVNTVKSEVHNKMVKSLMNIISAPTNYLQSTTLISTNKLNKLAEVDGTDMKLNPFNMVDDVRLDAQGMQGNDSIGVNATATRDYSLVYKARQKTDRKDERVNTFAPKSYLDTYLVDSKDTAIKALAKFNPGLKKQLIDESPNGLMSLIIDGHVYHAQVVADDVMEGDKYKNALKDIHYYKAGTLSGEKGVVSEINQLIAINKGGDGFLFNTITSATSIKAWELFSELLTAATDNAKLLLLHKLNLTDTSIGLVHTMLTMGFSIEVAFKFISQPTIKKWIKTSDGSFNILDNSPFRGLRSLIKSEIKRGKGVYDDYNGKVIYTSRGYISALDDHADGNITEEKLGKAVQTEITNPAAQLLMLLDIQDSLRIVSNFAGIASGIEANFSDIHSKLSRIEKEIQLRLTQQQVTPSTNAKDRQKMLQNRFNINKFFLDKDYRDQQIELLGESTISGYNFLEVIAQNADIFNAQLQYVKASKVLGEVQQVNAAITKVIDKINLSPDVDNYTNTSDYIDYTNKVDEILVFNFFKENAADYSNVVIPGIEGQSFNFLLKEDRVAFLSNMGRFFKYLQERSISGNSVDEHYADNLFLATLSIGNESFAAAEADSPKVFSSVDVNNFKLSHLSKIRRGYKSLDPQDREMFELYSLLVNKSAKSTGTYEVFLDFTHLEAYNKFKDLTLNEEGAFDAMLDEIPPLHLLLNSRGSIRKPGANDAVPRNNEFSINDVGLHQDSESNVVYATTSEFEDLGDDIWFPIHKVGGFNAVAYDVENSKNLKGMQAILSAGFSPYKLKYKRAGSNEIVDGYILFQANKVSAGDYILLDSDYRYDKVGSEANSQEQLSQLNPNMVLNGAEIQYQPKSKQSFSVDESKLTSDIVNAKIVDSIIQDSVSLVKEIRDNNVTSIVSQETFLGLGKKDIGKVIKEHRYSDGTVIAFKYDGKHKIREGDKYSSYDSNEYGNKMYHHLAVEIVSMPRLFEIISPDTLNTGIEKEIDRIDFQRKLSKSAIRGLLDRKIFYTAVGQEEDVPEGRVITVITDGKKYETFIREDYINYGSIEELQVKLNLNSVDDIYKVFGAVPGDGSVVDMFVNKDEEEVYLKTYKMVPYNTSVINYVAEAAKLKIASGLEIPQEFRVTVDSSEGVSKVLKTSASLKLDKSQIKEVELTINEDISDHDALLDELINDYNSTVEADYHIDKEIVKNLGGILYTGIKTDTYSTIIMKVASIADIVPEYARATKGVSSDMYQGVNPSVDEQAALKLLYLKRTLPENTPLIVFDESSKSFKTYNPATGLFLTVSDRLPDIGDSPLLLDFDTSKIGSPDLDIIDTLLRNRSYIDTTFNTESDVNTMVKDQYLIDLSEAPTPALEDVAYSTDQGMTAIRQFVAAESAIVYGYGEGQVELAVNNDGQQIIEIDGKMKLASDYFNTFSEQVASEFKVVTYREDGTMLIDVTETDGMNVSRTVSYAVFPNEEVRNGFEGTGVINNLNGTILNSTGVEVYVTFPVAVITSEPYLLRRDKNIEERKEFKKINKGLEENYNVRIRELYIQMVQLDPTLQDKVRDYGGVDYFFKLLQSDISNSIRSEFTILDTILDGDTSLLEKFYEVYDEYTEAKASAKESENEYFKRIFGIGPDMQANSTTTNPYEVGIDPAEEIVMVFADSELTTNDALNAINEEFVVNTPMDNRVEYSSDEQGLGLGALLVNLFDVSESGNIVFTPNDVEIEMERAIRAAIESPTAYIIFPDLASTISDRSEITYKDLANLLITTFENMGNIPNSVKFSQNLAAYINANIGLNNVSPKQLRSAVRITSDPNLTGVVMIDQFLPHRILMGNDRTLAENLNIRKGLNMANNNVYESPYNNSNVSEQASPENWVKDIYKDWLRSNPATLNKLIGMIENQTVFVSKYNRPIQQLVEAVQDLALNKDFSNEIVKSYEIENVTKAGVTYKVVSQNIFERNAVSGQIGDTHKTTIDGLTYIVEVVGTKASVLTQSDDNVMVSEYTLLASLGIDESAMEDIQDAEDLDLIVKVYKDPDTSVTTGDFSRKRKIQIGDKVAKKLPSKFSLNQSTQDVLNKGHFVMAFDMDGNNEFLESVSKITGNTVYTKGIDSKTVVSMIGTVIGGLHFSTIYSPEDIGNFFDQSIKPMIDNYIFSNKLTVAVGASPGVESEIRAYILANRDYAVDSKGNLAYRAKSNSEQKSVQDVELMQDVLDDTEITEVVIISNAIRGLNINNGQSNSKDFVSSLVAPVAMVEEDENNILKHKQYAVQGKPITYSLKSEHEAAHLDEEFDGYVDFINTDYKNKATNNTEGVNVKDGNHDFIRKIITGIVTKNPYKTKLTQAETVGIRSITERIIDDTGRLVFHDTSNDKNIPGHAMLHYAVGRSKHAALMLLKNNLGEVFKLEHVIDFIEKEINLDKSNPFIEISEQEIINISGKGTPTLFEVMLYDITHDKANYNTELVPSQVGFYGKLMDKGIGVIEAAVVDSEFVINYIIDTSLIVEKEDIKNPKYDSNRNSRKNTSNQGVNQAKQYGSGLYKYLLGSNRYSMTSKGIEVKTKEGPVKIISAQRAVEGAKLDALIKMYQEIGLKVGPEELYKFIRDNKYINEILTDHIKYSSEDVSLLETMFGKHGRIGLPEFDRNVMGRVSKLSSSFKLNGKTLVNAGIGITLISNGKPVFINDQGQVYTDNKYTYNVFEIATQRRPGNAEQTNPGDIYQSIKINGKVKNTPIKLIRSAKTGEVLAENIATLEYYVYDEISEGWTTVKLGYDNSEFLFVAAQLPKNMGPHTRQIAANGQLFNVSGVKSVSRNVITTLEGWKFKYTPKTKSYAIIGTDVKPSPRRDIRMQKEEVSLANDIGYDTQSKKVDSKVLQKIVRKLSSNLGIEAAIMTSDQIREEFGSSYANTLGFTFNGKIIINKDRATLDTPVHEFGHFFFRHLRMTDPDLFLKLKDVAFKSNGASAIQAKYKELGETSNDMAEEILTSMLGVMTQRQALDVGSKGIVRRALDTLKSWFNDLFGVKDKKYDIDLDTPLTNIMEQIGGQLLYGPRSVLNDMSQHEKGYLNRIMSKVLSEKDAVSLLEQRGFIVEVC